MQTREEVIRTTPVSTNTTLVMSSGSGRSMAHSKPVSRKRAHSLQQSSSSTSTVAWVSAEHFNQKMHFAYGYPNDSSTWMVNAKPNLAILQTIKNLRNSLTDLDDRWQVEIWIKHIAKYLEVDEDLEFDVRDTIAAVPTTEEQPSTDQDQVKGKKRSLNSITDKTKKQRSANKKSRSVVESSDEDTPEPSEDNNEYIFENDA